MNTAWRFHTHLTATEAKEHSSALVQQLKKPSIHTQLEKSVDFNNVFPTAVVKDPLPIICILNGAGAGGKGTFASLVDKFSTNGAIELSTIDPCRPAAEVLLKYSEDLAEPYSTNVSTADKIIAEKGDAYRQLLHDIKCAWDKSGHASQRYGIAEIMKAINEHTIVDLDRPEMCFGFVHANGFSNKSIMGALNITRDPFASEEYHHWMSRKSMIVPFKDHIHVYTKEMPSVIFMNIREINNIEEFQRECYELGLLCITLLVDGRTDTETWSNEGDRQVLDMKYDIIVENKLDVDSLSMTAFMFAKFIERANKLYGVSTETAVKSLIAGKYFWEDEETEPSSK